MLKYANIGLYILDLVVQILLEPDKKVPSPHLYHLGFIVDWQRETFQYGIRVRRSRV
jgi:hypothetical protein